MAFIDPSAEQQNGPLPGLNFFDTTGTVTTPPTANTAPNPGQTATPPAATPPTPNVGASPSSTSNAPASGGIPTTPDANPATEPTLNFTPPNGTGGAGSSSPSSPSPSSNGGATTPTSGGGVTYAGPSSTPMPGGGPGSPMFFAEGGGIPEDAGTDDDNLDPITGALSRAMNTVSMLLDQGRKAAGIGQKSDDQAPMGSTWGQMPNTSGIPDAPTSSNKPIGGSRRPGEMEPLPLHDDDSDKGYSNPTMTGKPPPQVQDAARGGSISNGSSRLAGIKKGGSVPAYAKGGSVQAYEDGGDVTETADENDMQRQAAGTVGQDQDQQGGIPGSPWDVKLQAHGNPLEGLLGPGGQMKSGLEGAAQTEPGSDRTQPIKDLLAGKGAMPTGEMAQHANEVDPQRQMPAAQRHLLVVDKIAKELGPEAGLSATQYFRSTVVGMNATAAAQLAGTDKRPADLTLAARTASEASDYTLDGTHVDFQPTRGGVTAVVTENGKQQQIPLTVPQFNQYLHAGPMHVDGHDQQGATQYLQAFAQNQGKPLGGQQAQAPAAGQQPGATPTPTAAQPQTPAAAPAAKEKNNVDWAAYAGPLVELPGVGKVYKNLWDMAKAEHGWASEQPQMYQRYNQLVKEAHEGQADKSKGGLSYDERKSLEDVKGGFANQRAQTRAGATTESAQIHAGASENRTSAMRDIAGNRNLSSADMHKIQSAKAILGDLTAPADQHEAARKYLNSIYGHGSEEQARPTTAGQGASQAVRQQVQQHAPTQVNQQQAPRVVNSKADYDNLPSGTPFTWQGKTGTKP